MNSEAGTGTGEFVDRSGRLILFGVLATGVGLLSFAVGLLQIAMLFLGPLLSGPGGLSTDAASLVTGATLYGLIGAAFVWVGLGSIRKRRWVRAMMLTLAWTWLAGGLLAAIIVPRLMDSLLLTLLPRESAGLLVSVQMFVVVFLVGAGVLLPAAFIWAYRDPDVQRTCEAHDLRPCWTERCPTQVLGLSVGLGACALIVLPMLARPALPFFTVVLTGWPAAGALLLGAAACAYLARSTYRMEMSGWWGTVALLTLLGLATGVAFAVLDPGEMYRALGYPEEQAEALVGADIGGGGLGVGLSAALTVASLAYMAGIRKHFTARNDS